MKIVIIFALILLLTTQLNAETYSWVDDSGTYNFTEDYSSVPKKYRKKVKRREDMPQDMNTQSESTGKQSEKPEAKSAAIPGDKSTYGGKSYAVWRNELDIREAELISIEQRMEQMRKQSKESKWSTEAQFDVLKKDYDAAQADYDQKYKSYIELVETIRKTGLKVEIRK